MARIRFCLVMLPLFGLTIGGVVARAAERPLKQRTFRFTYAASLTGLASAKQVRVWLPVPRSSSEQCVRLLTDDLPVEPSVNVEPRYGNRILYFELAPPASGRIPLRLTYRVERRELRGIGRGSRSDDSGQLLTKREKRLFLSANALVPLDGKPLDLIAGLELPQDPVALSRVLYDRVDEHMKYDKSKPGYGRGDAAWACDSRFGNCTDFHSLFIALARSQRVPARFEIGFPLPPQRGSGEIGGYHCWGMFHVEGKGWVPVDISEADKHPEMKDYFFGNLTENRVAFSIGRDLTLVPRQSGLPLNFFIYPYVEVDGKPLAKQQIQLNFRYEDLSL